MTGRDILFERGRFQGFRLLRKGEEQSLKKRRDANPEELAREWGQRNPAFEASVTSARHSLAHIPLLKVLGMRIRTANRRE